MKKANTKRKSIKSVLFTKKNIKQRKKGFIPHKNASFFFMLNSMYKILRKIRKKCIYLKNFICGC